MPLDFVSQPIQQIQQWIVHDRFIAIWCGITLLYFAVCLCLLLARALPLSHALRRVARPLRAVNGLEAFARQFESYDQTVRSVKRLRHPWHEFKESLIPPREGEVVVRNTQEPSAYFNDGTVVQPSVHSRFFDTVPNHLVGLGILGTFLGLAAGVGLASGGLNAEHPKEVQEALSNLLSGASLAFVTSIFGLGSSLVFLFVERLLVGSVHRSLDRWVTQLEACVELVTPEKIGLDQLEQEKRQTKQLEGFSDQLVFALEQAFDNAVVGRLAPSLDKVVTAIEGLRTDRDGMNQSGIEQLAREFLDNLSQSTGREMEQIQATLQTLGAQLLDVTESLRTASRGFGDQIAGAGAQIQASGRATAEELIASVQPFADAIARFERATMAHADLSSHIEGMTEGLRAAGETVVEAHRGFQGALEPMRSVARGMEASAEHLSGSVHQTSGLIEQAANAASSIQMEQEKISAAWRDYEQRFQGVDQAVQRAFEQLDEGVRRYADQIREFHTEIDQQMSKVTHMLAAETADLRDAIEGLGEKVQVER